MNQIKAILFKLNIFILSAFLFSCSDSSEQAAKYCNRVTTEHNKVMQAIENLDSAFAGYRVPHKMDKAYKNLGETIDSVKHVLSNLSGPEDKELKNSALQLLGIYKETAQNEFSKMISLYKLPDKNYAQSEMDEWEELSLSAYNKIKNAQKKFIQEQIRYSEKTGFSFEETKQ